MPRLTITVDYEIRAPVGWGIYNGMDATADRAFSAATGTGAPAVGNSYYMAHNGALLPIEQNRLADGTTPLIDLIGRWPDKPRLLWSEVPTGKHDALFTRWINWVDALGAQHGRNVLFSWDAEPETILEHEAATMPGQTLAHYVTAWRHVRNLPAAQAASNITWVWWISGWNQAMAEACYPGDEFVDMIGADPYKWAHHPAGDGPLQTWGGYFNRLDSIYGDVPRCIPETGIDLNGPWGEAGAVDWWAAAPDAAAELGLKFVNFFNRTANGWWRLTDPVYPNAIAAFRDSMARMSAQV